MAFRTGSFAAGFAAITLPTTFQFWGSSKKKDDTQEPAKADKAETAKAMRLCFKGGVSNIPHDDKVHKGGEDAFTVSPQLVAVADGVGGWARKGIDPGLFSKQLTKDIQQIFDEHGSTKTLKEILIEAV